MESVQCLRLDIFVKSSPLLEPSCLINMLADCHHLIDVQDYSITLLKKVLKQVEIIKNSRSGMPNFESSEIEANDLQAAVVQYLQFRGTGKVLQAFSMLYLFPMEHTGNYSFLLLSRLHICYVLLPFKFFIAFLDLSELMVTAMCTMCWPITVQ